MRTRALGGSIPGPTYEIYPGDTFEITFDNRCVEQSTRGTTISEYRLPDTSNLHWHGAHTSSAEPGDDILVAVEP